MYVLMWVSISLCVFTVATPKPSRSPVRHHNGPRKSIWRFETPKTISPLRPATLPPSTIIPFSRFILPQRHDRVRNHKEPINQEGIMISPEDRRTNRNRAAYGEDLWGSGAGGWDMAVGRRWHNDMDGERSVVSGHLCHQSFDWWPSGCFSHSPLRIPALWRGFPQRASSFKPLL